MDNSQLNLKPHAFRMTPQRMVILRILSEADTHLSPLEIYHRAQAQLPGLTEATVYRTLGFLASQRLAMAAHVGNGQLVYEIAVHNHHHLICRSCGDTCEVSHDLLASLYDQLKEKTGFQVDGMHVTFFGLCPSCKSGAPNAAINYTI